MYSFSIPTDHTITTTEATIDAPLKSNDSDKYAFLFLNKGSVDATIKIYGSPVNVDNFKSEVTWTAAELALLESKVVENTVSANDNLYVDLSSYAYNYYRITAVTASGETTLNYFVMKSDYKS